jgi:hypothetical protein
VEGILSSNETIDIIDIPYCSWWYPFFLSSLEFALSSLVEVSQAMTLAI